MSEIELGIAIVAGVVAVIALCVWAVQWGRARRAEIESRTMQDLLARGLAVEDIERLLKLTPGPAPVPQSPAPRRPSATALAVVSALESMYEADNSDEMAAFLGAFLPRFEEPQEAGEARRTAGLTPRELEICKALTTAITSMFEVGKETQEVASFLDALLKPRSEQDETNSEPGEPLPSLGPACPPSEAFRQASRPG
jgi:hypothetical protein